MMYFFFFIEPIVSPPLQRQSLHYADVRLFINIILYHSPELDKGEQKPHIKTRKRLSIRVHIRAMQVFIPEKNA